MGRRGLGTGQPLMFRCAQQRRDRMWPDSYDATDHLHLVVRTGRTRGPGVEHEMPTYSRMMQTSHEYRCSCGHVGWTRHNGILRRPIEGEQTDGS